MGDPLNSCCSCKLTSNAILRALFKCLTFTKCCGIFLSEEAHFVRLVLVELCELVYVAKNLPIHFLRNYPEPTEACSS